MGKPEAQANDHTAADIMAEEILQAALDKGVRDHST
jgi:hypothetical protein